MAAGQRTLLMLISSSIHRQRKLHSSCYRLSTGHGPIGITVGAAASLTRCFSADDVCKFAELTGDLNPVHTDEAWARTNSAFGRPVVHGTLTLGLVSGLIATRLPGPGSLLVRQDVRYPAPLYVNEQVTASVELLKYRHKLAELALRCTAPDERVVLEGTVYVFYEA